MDRKIISLSDMNTIDITPILYGTEQCPENGSFGPAARNCYIVHFVFSGKGSLDVNGKKYEIGPNQVFILRPNEVAYYQADKTDPWHYAFVNFNTILAVSMLSNTHVMDGSAVKHIFESLAENVESGNTNIYYVCGKLFELLSVLENADHLPYNVNYVSSKLYELIDILENTDNLPFNSSYAIKAKNYMEIYYNTPITVQGLAEQLNIDRRYLCSLFKKQFLMSPQQYLMDFRMKRAAAFLTKQGLSAGETALMCGYPDVFSFSKMFKRKYGISPLKYKQQFDASHKRK